MLQRINSAIFQDVELLHRNIDAVTAHIRGKLEKAGEKDIDRKVLSFVKVKDGEKTYWSDGENYWRISLFIPDTVTKEEVNPEHNLVRTRNQMALFRSTLKHYDEMMECIRSLNS